MRYLRYLGVMALLCSCQSFAQDTADTTATADMDRIITMGEAGNIDAALEGLDALLESNPRDLEALYYQGLLKLQQDDLHGAEDAFNQVLEYYPEVAEAANNLALAQARMGQYNSARISLQRAIALDPDFAAANANLGDLYVRMAVEAYRKAGEGYQDDPEATRANAAKLEFLNQMFEKP